MTGWTTRPERHIPEEELHAYLDQALSRSQCAEIETHLSACRTCQLVRANVAALRDRTTALLSGLTPRPVIVPPSYLSLSQRHSRRLAIAIWQARVRRSALWAAAVVAAVGSGWIARSVTDPHRNLSSTMPLAQTVAEPAPVAPRPVEDPTAQLEREATPAPLPEERTPLPATRASGSQGAGRGGLQAPTLRLASVVTPAAFTRAPDAFTSAPAQAELPAPVADGSQFKRLWRLVPWEDALQVAGSGLPFIEGMTVVGVLFHPGAPGERPTVIVTQQNQAGELIHSIEGPVARVSDLVQRQAGPDSHASEAARTPPDYVEEPGNAPRRVLRVLTVTGKLPVDSLNVLARNATIR